MLDLVRFTLERERQKELVGVWGQGRRGRVRSHLPLRPPLANLPADEPLHLVLAPAHHQQHHASTAPARPRAVDRVARRACQLKVPMYGEMTGIGLTWVHVCAHLGEEGEPPAGEEHKTVDQILSAYLSPDRAVRAVDL